MENTGLVSMLRNDKVDDLSRMYKLFGRVSEGLEEMKKIISNHLFECGTKINDDPSTFFFFFFLFQKNKKKNNLMNVF